MKFTNKIVSSFIATVWLLNGMFCKVLNFVPRHEEIVSRILGNEYSRLITILIGVSEIVIAIWFLTKFKSKVNAIVQMIVVAMMNIIEFIITPDLLLWGRLNIIFAFIFIGIIYHNEFVLNKKSNQQTII